MTLFGLVFGLQVGRPGWYSARQAPGFVVLAEAAGELDKLKAQDYRGTAASSSRTMQRFWDRWREEYGDTGLKNPRGDRLLTELAVRALRELKPRLALPGEHRGTLRGERLLALKLRAEAHAGAYTAALDGIRTAVDRGLLPIVF